MAEIPSTTNASSKIAIAPTAIDSNKVRRMLGFSLHGWENAMVVFLIIAGFFALIAGAATWAVVRLQRIELAQSRAAFDRYKIDAAKDVAKVRSDADTKIGVAREEARVAVEKAQADIANANKAIEQARAETAKAAAGAAAANERAALLEQETTRLKIAAAWRTIKKEQYDSVVATLRGQTFEVWTTFVGDDPEATLYRNDIDKMLQDAGLKTKYFSGWKVSIGLKIVADPIPEFAVLEAAFRQAGIPFHVEQRDDNLDFRRFPGLLIIVGTKPSPF
jgi:hypothetical protein